MTKKDNMKLWEQVCQTDPATTKKVNQRGGFTAIAAQSQIKKATEIWGAMGDSWGLKNLLFGQIPNDPTQEPVEVTLQAEFYCPEGAIEIATDMLYKAGNDSRKKLITDATTKALSKLGFNSDVFEGLFDDNKYVNDMQERFAGSNGEKKTVTMPKPKEAETPIVALKRRMREVGVNTKEKYEILLHHVFGKADIKDLGSGEMAHLRKLVTAAEKGEKELGFDGGGCQINDTNIQALKEDK